MNTHDRIRNNDITCASVDLKSRLVRANARRAKQTCEKDRNYHDYDANSKHDPT